MGRRMPALDETWRGGLYMQDREYTSEVFCTQSELETGGGGGGAT